MTRLGAFLGSAVLVGLFAGPAQGAPFEQTLVATGGDIFVTFVSNGAELSSDLWLDGDAGDELGALFNNWTTAVGTSMDLGSFAEGTELVFKLIVGNAGSVFYTGQAARNPDGVVHAKLESGTDQTLVGFEDLFGGGDRDYNDLVFAFTNAMPIASRGAAGADGVSNAGGTPSAVSAPAMITVDEPGTLVMLGSGLSMLVFAIRGSRLSSFSSSKTTGSGR